MCHQTGPEGLGFHVPVLDGSSAGIVEFGLELRRMAVSTRHLHSAGQLHRSVRRSDRPLPRAAMERIVSRHLRICASLPEYDEGC